MNSKAAKVLRKYARILNLNYKSVKRTWVAAHRDQRKLEHLRHVIDNKDGITDEIKGAMNGSRSGTADKSNPVL